MGLKENITILAIETSCDETSVAVMENGREIRANIISSQIEDHQVFGGVVPEIASRLHLESINGIIDAALREAKISFSDLDAVAVTKGPGLVGAILVGVSAAKAISLSLGIPLLGVNHMQGHICANYIAYPELEPPFVSLVVSGGHSYLIEVLDYTNYVIHGRTRDDAAGECFDKVARTLGLGYPGGPQIDRLYFTGNPQAIEFPRVIIDKQTYDFSFSGLKTAVINYVHQHRQKGQPIVIADVAASFQQAVIDVLVDKSFRLLDTLGYDKLVVSGGVAANRGLRDAMATRASKTNTQVLFPPILLCTDNAAMIGCQGYYDYIGGRESDLAMRVYPNLSL